MTKPQSLEGRQEGGRHYKGLAIEPYQFVMRNDWDPLAFTILKRISRHREKDKDTDILKALHEVDIRVDLWNADCIPRTQPFERIRMMEYVNANNLGEHEAKAAFILEAWVLNPHKEDEYVGPLKAELQAIVGSYSSGRTGA